MYKKILVISNNCFSLENSNGRTLAGFVKGWPIDRIAQFYTYNEVPNSGVCNNYFRVTDKQALFSMLKGSVAGKVDLFEAKKEKVRGPQKRLTKFRNPLIMLLRNFIWDLGFWKGKYFNDWVNVFNPDLIFVQAGDTAYRLRIATNLAKKRNIPLIIYNSENYYFKDYNYMSNTKFTNIFYSVFIKKFRKQLRASVNYALHTIYNNEPLKEDFDAEFNKPSSVIYNPSDIIPIPYGNTENKKLKLSYLGNLGLGRHESLIDLANVIQSINPSLSLDVFGKCPTLEIEEAFMECSSIDYKGFISYKDVKAVISQSDILFHVENFSDFYIKDLKYGFSTKIADSLMSGKCFFLYAPESLACTKYMVKNNQDCVATSSQELMKKIKIILDDPKFRIECSQKCIELAKKNHSEDVVDKQFFNIVNS
tara:strand:- start:7110 stop:8375 length:1266 start_codon:yes stop_codon:yes gene_type:complete